MSARLVLVLRWALVAAIVVAIALIVLRRKVPPRPVSTRSLADSLREIWLRWRDMREDSRERAENLAALRGTNILVADPDAKSARVLTWRFNKLRCAVHRTRTAAQALSKARDVNPDVVVADALLADMTAADLFQSLPKRDVPVVFIGVLPNQWDELRSLGRNVACLSKPFDPDEVASLAGMIIRRTKG